MSNLNTKPTYFYHPVKVLCLDDNRAFLDLLELEFNEKLNLTTLTNPKVALQVIEDHPVSEAVPSSLTLINTIDADTINEKVVSFDISKILNLLYDKTRFQKVPLLVVDYAMPEINGVEFCQKLKEKKLFKIMLTAEADQALAVKAFNEGLIDKFILKTAENLYSELHAAVHELTQRHFKELTKNLVLWDDGSLNALFANPAYLQLFSKILKQAQAVEYYLVDNSGSMLFLDENAKPTWLIIKHKKELDEQVDLLDGYELPKQVMDSVRNKEKVLFLLSEEEYKKPVTEWINYLFAAEKLDDNYFYSITQNYATDSIDWGRVVAYNSLKNR